MSHDKESNASKLSDKDNNLEVQILDTSYHDECAATMAQAFVDSPSYVYVLKDVTDRTKRIQALQWLFARNLQILSSKCPTALRGVVDPDRPPGERVVVCFVWNPSEHQKLSFGEMLSAGLWQVPFRFGWNPLQRLLGVLDAMAEGTPSDATAADQDFVMLERMAVRPSCQGQGYGTRALRQVLAQEELEVHLSTQETRTVRFYQRLGFEIVDEQVYFEQDAASFRSWYMVRRPPQG